jgi:CAAX prenyl protease-like protein
MTEPSKLDYEPKQETGGWLRDEIAYVAPMAVFLTCVWVGTTWESLYVPAYVVRAVVVAILLAVFWRHYTKIRWDYWWLGGMLGVIGIFQWVGMQNWLSNHFEWFAPKDWFDPTTKIASPRLMWGFIAIRVAGAVLVVPVMEELFWRDYLWRQILAPNDFKLAQVGEFDWTAFVVVSLAFATVHGTWWPTAIVWGTMIGLLLVYTKSLGACVIMHAVTNQLLAA